MPSLVIWYGHVTTRSRMMLRGAVLSWLGLGWIVGFLILPSLALVLLAFLSTNHLNQIVFDFTLDHFKRVAGFTVFGWTTDYLRILWRSIVIGFVTTAICLVLAYPLAFWIAAKPRRTRYLWLCLIVIPLCVNLVIRTYAWMLLLSAGMFPSRFLQWIGVLDPGVGIYPSAVAVYLGMTTALLPFCVLPIYTNVERMDWSIVEASRDLYASSWRVFTHAILPQTLPGLAVAVLLTFVPAMGMFVVPDLLAAGKYWLIGNVIQQQFGPSRNWPFGAAMSLTLMAMTLAVVLVAWRMSRRTG